jgi:hypothetical protein
VTSPARTSPGGNRPGQGRGKLKQETPQALLDEARKENLAVQAVLRGMTYEQAATAAGYANKSGAYKAVQRALARTAQDIATNADALRALEIARLDRMLLELSTIALSSATAPETKLKYLEAMRRNVETRARILGLNAPIQHEVFTHDALNLKISELAESLGLPVPDDLIEPGWGSSAPAQAALPEGPATP